MGSLVSPKRTRDWFSLFVIRIMKRFAWNFLRSLSWLHCSWFRARYWLWSLIFVLQFHKFTEEGNEKLWDISLMLFDAICICRGGKFEPWWSFAYRWMTVSLTDHDHETEQRLVQAHSYRLSAVYNWNSSYWLTRAECQVSHRNSKVCLKAEHATETAGAHSFILVVRCLWLVHWAVEMESENTHILIELFNECGLLCCSFFAPPAVCLMNCRFVCFLIARVCVVVDLRVLIWPDSNFRNLHHSSWIKEICTCTSPAQV